MKLAVMKEPSPANNGESAPLDTGPGWRIGVSAIRVLTVRWVCFYAALCPVGPTLSWGRWFYPHFTDEEIDLRDVK